MDRKVIPELINIPKIEPDCLAQTCRDIRVPLASSPIRAPPDLQGRIFFHVTEIKQQQVEEMHHTDAGYTKTLPSCAFAQINRNCMGREIRIC